MLALTTIAPNRVDHQKKCIDTWIYNWFNVISFNTAIEIKKLQPFFPNVTFIETDNTKDFGKPYISLNVFLDYIRSSKEKCMIINSDIELYNMPKGISELMEEGVITARRLNYNGKRSDSSFFDAGFDLFFIDKKFIDLYDDNDFAIGQCHFDYWILFRAIRLGKKAFCLDNRFSYHQQHGHSNQYALGHWKTTAIHLIQKEKLSYELTEKGCWQMNKYVLDQIKINMKGIEL